MSDASSTDPRVQIITDLLIQLARGNFDVKGQTTGSDALDSVILGLNMLAEEFGAQALELRRARDELERRVVERTTELQTANEELRRWGLIFETTGLALVIANEDGDVELLNPAARRMYGFAPRHVRDTYAPAVRDQLELHTNQIERAGHLTFETQHVRAIGEVFPVQVNGTSVTDPTDETKYYVTTVEDISQRRKMQERLQISERMASLGTLAAGVAHEINNPLTYVLANLELAVERMERAGADVPLALAREFGQYSREAAHGAERIRQIVRGLGSLSRADPGKPGAVDLRPVLDTAIKVTNNAVRHRARVVRHHKSVPIVAADESRLVQVFVNLLVNAADSIPEGDAEQNRITISTRTNAEGWAVVEMHDTGQGLPPDLMARIFEPFVTTKPDGKGSGLGLFISQGIVASLGGSLSAERAPAGGSTFRVSLPPADERQIRSARRPSRSPTPAPKRARILVIDDDALVAASVQRALATLHDVVVCDSAKEALKRIDAAEHFDVILCDLMMPVLTGEQLHRRLSQSHPQHAERMIFMSGGAFTDSAENFLAEVANPFIEKPFSIAPLRGLIRELLDGGGPPAPR